MAHYQGQIFQKFKEKERFANMVFKFSVSKLAIVFKIAFSKLIDNYKKQELKNKKLIAISSLFKKKLKTIREIWKENASEFK